MLVVPCILDKCDQRLQFILAIVKSQTSPVLAFSDEVVLKPPQKTAQPQNLQDNPSRWLPPERLLRLSVIVLGVCTTVKENQHPPKPTHSACLSMSSSADLLVYHQPTLYLQRAGDYQWQLPAPNRDRYWQRRDRPYMSPQQPRLNHFGAFPESSRRSSISSSRTGAMQPRSSTAMAHHSPSSSTHISSPRDLYDMRSISENIVSHTYRPESLTKSLVSKGYKLFRRRNSRSDLTSLRPMDWAEQSNEENPPPKLLRHSRWQSADSGMSEHNHRWLLNPTDLGL